MRNVKRRNVSTEGQQPAFTVRLIFCTVNMIIHQPYHTVINRFTAMTERQGKPLLRSCHADFTRTTLEFAQSYLQQLHYNAQRFPVGLFCNYTLHERDCRLVLIW